MGNILRSRPARVLELRFSAPRVELPPHRDGSPSLIFAKLAVQDEREPLRDVTWDEDITVALPSDTSVVLITFLVARSHGDLARGNARHLSDLSLPYVGLVECGVSPGNPITMNLAFEIGAQCETRNSKELAAELRRLREIFQPDRAWITVRASEVTTSPLEGDHAAIPQPEWTVSAVKRQVITLELQNSAMQQRLRAIAPDAPDAAQVCIPSHARQLRMIQQENMQLSVEKSEVQRRYGRIRTSLMEAKQGKEQHWVRTMQVFHQELMHCQERKDKIRENFQERLHGLRTHLQQASAQLMHMKEMVAHELPQQKRMDVQAGINAALSRREELKRHLMELRSSKSSEPHPKIQHLRTLSEEYQSQLELLRHELASKQEKDQKSGSQSELRNGLQLLYEELDAMSQAREDERVRRESEVRELKSERDVVKDQVADAASDLQQVQAKAEAFRTLSESHAQDGQEDGSCLPKTVMDLRAENGDLEQRLAELTHGEAAREQTIRDLEQQQEMLVEKTTLYSATSESLSAVAGEDDYVRRLEDRVFELQGVVANSKRNAEEQRGRVEQLRRAALESAARAQEMAQEYERLQEQADERAWTHPTASAWPETAFDQATHERC